MAMTLRLTDEETDALRVTAEREGRSMQDVARQAVGDYTSAHAKAFDSLLDDIVTSRRDAIRRLGEA